MLKTKFWRNAANSLPSSVRNRYMVQFEGAERFELAIDAIVEGWKLFTRQVPAPRVQAR